MTVKPGFPGPFNEVILSIPGQGDEQCGTGLFVLAKLLCNAKPVELGQADVADDNVRFQLVRLPEPFKPIRRNMNVAAKQFQQEAHGTRLIRIVFYQQYLLAHARNFFDRCRRFSCGRTQRQHYGKSCATALPRTLGKYLAAVQIDYAPDQCQSKPEPALLAIQALITLGERFEQLAHPLVLGEPVIDYITKVQHEIRAQREDAAVLVLTMFEDDDSVFAAMRAGALGYLLKGAAKEEIREVVASNLCRCTGYQTIVEAVDACAVRRRQGSCA